MISSQTRAVFDLLVERRSEAQRLPEEAALHPQVAAGHDVVERRHALEQGDVLERAGDALRRRLVGLHAARAPGPRQVIAPFCG